MPAPTPKPLPVRHEAPEWADLGAALPRDLARARLGPQEADDWSLTLRAAALPHRLLRAGRGWRILVPPSHLEAAAAEIEAFLREQSDTAPSPPPKPRPFAPAAQVSVLVIGLATAFFVYSKAPHPGLRLYPEMFQDLGAADSTRILAGQWWRALTALTLHADAGHFLGNAVIGGVFTAILARTVGAGRAWMLFVLSGLAGNLINAWFHGPGHLSIGASTAVFGVVGAMSASARATHRKLDLVRSVAPVAAGLGLLGMLGTGGERTDLGAHLFGFLAGLPLGAGVGTRVARHGPGGTRENLLLGAAALGLIVVAWAFAFGQSG